MVLHQYDKKLILEDGSVYYGTGFGCDEEQFFEIVFNTSPVGYRRYCPIHPIPIRAW